MSLINFTQFIKIYAEMNGKIIGRRDKPHIVYDFLIKCLTLHFIKKMTRGHKSSQI